MTKLDRSNDSLVDSRPYTSPHPSHQRPETLREGPILADSNETRPKSALTFTFNRMVLHGKSDRMPRDADETVLSTQQVSVSYVTIYSRGG